MTFQEPDEIVYTEDPIVQNSTGTQIELSKSTDIFEAISLAHGIYSNHSSDYNSDNRIRITVWNPEEDPDALSNNPIIEMSADNKVTVVHILPLINEEYSIGSDEKRWLIVVGNRMYNDTTQSKTLSTHSGR
jgi:hypothetical protein